MAHVSPANSSNVPLAAGGVFVGEYIQASDFSAVSVLIHSDQASANNGLQLEWSTDGVNVDDRQSFNYAGSLSGLGLAIHVTVRARYMRVRYVNTALVAQAFMRLQTLLHNTAPQGSIGYLGQAVTTNDDTLVTKAVLAARSISTPSNVLLPFCSDDPFLIVTRPPNSSVIFKRSISASLFSTQLDFFGIGGANRDYMSVANNANSDLLVHLGFDPVSASNFTERVKPGETFRLGLSWILYGGPVQGIWLTPGETAGPVKFARLRATAIGDTTIVPAVVGAKIRVVGYTVTTQTANAAIDLFFKSGASTDLGAVLAIDGLFPASYAGGLDAPAFETAAGQPFVVGLTAAKSVDGHVAYVEVTTPALVGNAQVVELV